MQGLMVLQKVAIVIYGITDTHGGAPARGFAIWMQNKVMKQQDIFVP